MFLGYYAEEMPNMSKIFKILINALEDTGYKNLNYK